MERTEIFTDMAIEFCKTPQKSFDGVVKYYETDVNDAMAKKLNRPVGKYSTFETSAVLGGERNMYSRVSDALSRGVSSYIDGCRRALFVGLGNPDLTADALGDRIFKRIIVSKKPSDKFVCALTPNVFGMTGIESFDIISAVASVIKPDVIVAADALTAAAPSRLASAFQITDSGITPGSGVYNHRRRLDSRSLGVRVISIGVPLVVFSSTIAREYCPSAERDERDMIVTPKDVDVLVEDCAVIIADALNRAFEKIV